MDFDATIERLNALKLQERAQPARSDELRRLQEENLRLAREFEQQAQRWELEMRELAQRLEASERQNQLLKSALGEMDAQRHEIQSQQIVIDELQGQVKQLRLANYRLQYVVQQSNARDSDALMPPRPPDVF